MSYVTMQLQRIAVFRPSYSKMKVISALSTNPIPYYNPIPCSDNSNNPIPCKQSLIPPEVAQSQFGVEGGAAVAHDLAVLDLREEVSHRLAGLVPPILRGVMGGGEGEEETHHV